MQHVRSRIVGVNIPTSERIVTGILGAAAIAFGAKHRGVSGAVAAGLGTVAIVRAITGRCPAYRARAARRGIHVRRVVTIQAKPAEVYAMWRDLTNLPRFMSHVKSVTVEDGNISRWAVEVAGRSLEWRAEIVEDEPDRRLRWKSLDGDIRHEGEIDIREQSGDRGTVVEVKMHYFPPGGLIVAGVLYGFLRKIAKVDIGTELARLRQLLETGEISTGARRVPDVDENDTAVTAQQLSPKQTSPVTTAQTSTHDVQGTVRTAPTGGLR
ncbi:MAG: SRPBCC family protein [Myxococcota bacterium]|nr:SRPBCC family protein [Myxococcota bacterium]